ncbi:unnamed protein product [Paramecium primaurelia]|uniref:Uncharacterized protein n=1 Tax=Paramecium primaurelia TaxID=5886 RepID=A0A8S1K6K4_PARPR|nr:unnamed protein product [Paramecium primaurelia]
MIILAIHFKNHFAQRQSYSIYKTILIIQKSKILQIISFRSLLQIIQSILTCRINIKQRTTYNFTSLSLKYQQNQQERASVVSRFRNKVEKKTQDESTLSRTLQSQLIELKSYDI